MTKMIKNILLSILLCLIVAVSADAAKSSGGVRMVQQPDGTTLSIQLLGDEHFSWYQTTDGVLLVEKDKVFYVGTVTGAGTLESSGIVAHNFGTRSAEEQTVAANQDKDKFFKQAETEVVQSKSAMSGNLLTSIEGYPSRWYCPHSGVVKVPVILMNYTDTVFRIGKTNAEVKAAFEKYFNDDTKTPYSKESLFNGYSSVKQYFLDASHGNLQFEFEVYGPYTTTYGHDYYGKNSGRGDALLKEAVTKTLNDINFDNFVQEGHDYVNMVCVMYAGAGANLSGNDNDFWPACYYGENISTKGEHKITTICGFPELAVYPHQAGGTIMRAGIGVTCHEMSHGMGLPDLYNDFGNTTDNNNNGPEDWDLMDGGENLYNGMWPCQMSAWEKEIFGWKDAIELTEGIDVTLYPLNKDNGQLYKVINPANKNEWYIIEAYQKDEWNYYVSGMYGSGLMITHVNTYTISSTALSMKPNTTAGKPNVTILPADGFLLSNYNVGKTFVYKGKEQTITNDMYRADLAGDPYPGTGKVTSLAAYKNYTGDEMVNKYPIYNITKNEDGSISFRFGFGLSSSSFDSKGGNLDFDANVEFAETPAAGLTCDVYSLNTETNEKSKVAAAQAILTIDDGNVKVVFKKDDTETKLSKGSYTFTIPDAKIQSEQALPLSATDIQFAVTDSISVQADVQAENVEVPAGSEITTDEATTAVKSAIDNTAVTQVKTGVEEAVKDTKDIDFGVTVPEGTPISMTVGITYNSAAVAKENSNTVVTSMSFDVTPTATVVVDGTTHTATIQNDNIEGTVTFRLPVDKNATNEYAYVQHESEAKNLTKINAAENGEKYIELEVSSFSKYSYELTNDTPTAINAISEQTEQQTIGVQKVIRNGKVVIVKDGKEYNLAGAIIK